MGVRKYLFWKCDDGIRSYKVSQQGKFEILKPEGRDVFVGGGWKEFFTWFDRVAAITENEYCDFCFLYESEPDFPELEYNYNARSSWDEAEIKLFCEKNITAPALEIFYSEDRSFLVQLGNVYDKSNIKKIYMRCIPEFSADSASKDKQTVDAGSEETSFLYRLETEKLQAIREK